MIIDLQNRINSDSNLKRFLYEESYWYKYLNRNPNNYKEFVNSMKNKYKLNTSDKLNNMLNNISMLQSFIDILK